MLVLAADAFVLAKAAYNRFGAPTAAIELTERELRLMRPQHESTFLFLRLAWEPAWGRFKFEDGPGWFDQTKLKELGYDCRLPLTDPSAPAHYRATQSREVLAVLEFNGVAPAGAGESRSTVSRLEAVDAGRDFAVLRKKYPDAQRFLIVPAVVALRYQQRWDPNTRATSGPAYLRGVVTELLAGEISVPHSQRRVFEALDGASDKYFATPDGRERGPRFAAVLYYGRNHEPWIGACRSLAQAKP
jgi:hypothetical protein